MRSDSCVDVSAGAPALEADNVARIATNMSVRKRMAEVFRCDDHSGITIRFGVDLDQDVG